MIKGIKYIIKRCLADLVSLGQQYEEEEKMRKYGFPISVSVYNVSVEGNVSIGEHTYINEYSRIDAGTKSYVKIGRHCAIGRNVHITSKTHDLNRPTTDETHTTILHKESSVSIGSYVWIGDKVTILPGVEIGDYAIIGAHSLVTKSVKEFEIVGGIPAKHIRFNTTHYKYNVKSVQ